MNERIKELAEQSGAVQYGVDYWRDTYPVNLEELKKFAELIVKEMVDECAKVCVQHAGWTPDMIAKQVKQHFGVEE